VPVAIYNPTWRVCVWVMTLLMYPERLRSLYLRGSTRTCLWFPRRKLHMYFRYTVRPVWSVVIVRQRLTTQVTTTGEFFDDGAIDQQCDKHQLETWLFSRA